MISRARFAMKTCAPGITDGDHQGVAVRLKAVDSQQKTLAKVGTLHKGFV
jgi:ribosomal protein S20